MITIDAVKFLMYFQLFLSAILFFFPQIVVLMRGKGERLADWIGYRSTWVATAIQVAFVLVLGILVWYTPTDPAVVGHAALLTLVNLAWFISLRVTLEFVDYYITRQESS